MIAKDRLQREMQFHDAQARRRAQTFASQPERLRFDDDEYLDHETWVRPAMERLGAVRGKMVLDWGCGHGMAAVVLARHGARVTACDLSAAYVREARQRARANRVTVDALQTDAHRLPFPAESFDAIWGHAILHHLDVPRAATELRRVLRPGGVAVLCEPWNGNPFLRWARAWGPRTEQTQDETPLAESDVATLRAQFASINVEGFQLLSVIPRVIMSCGANTFWARGDRRLLAQWPALQRWARYVVITAVA